jgi:hypothetical protein
MTYSSYKNFALLDDISFIGGSEYNLDFKVKDTSGIIIDITDKSFHWKMAQYGEKNTPVLEKTSGVYLDNYTIRFQLSGTDTENLAGKFIHQISFDIIDELSAPPEILQIVTLGTSPSFLTTGGFAQPSFPRLITIQGSESTCYGTITIDGTDSSDVSITEDLVLEGTTLKVSQLEFKTITRIDFPGYIVVGEEFTLGGGNYYQTSTIIPTEGIIVIIKRIG